ncbi:hypothetical protein L596_029962 [Steinernema carpocapsae]|uniref:Uncharacterized protein n=1 Tax=Steinernema carpocapsae TaxID=34508 RepID=A0A4U5LRC3_STECR|nr:hypothetical protein L596_029962 [Steinernema carpocapsae]
MGAKLNSCFSLLGLHVGTNPKTWAAVATLLWLIACVGLFLRSDLQAGLQHGYVGADAPSNEEVRAQRHFFGDKGTPWYMAVFARPKTTET